MRLWVLSIGVLVGAQGCARSQGVDGGRGVPEEKGATGGSAAVVARLYRWEPRIGDWPVQEVDLEECRKGLRFTAPSGGKVAVDICSPLSEGVPTLGHGSTVWTSRYAIDSELRKIDGKVSGVVVAEQFNDLGLSEVLAVRFDDVRLSEFWEATDRLLSFGMGLEVAQDRRGLPPGYQGQWDTHLAFQSNDASRIAHAIPLRESMPPNDPRSAARAPGDDEPDGNK